MLIVNFECDIPLLFGKGNNVQLVLVVAPDQEFPDTAAPDCDILEP
jgi:hypothetical protein